MYCVNCGKASDDSARFCDGCGQPLSGTGTAPEKPAQSYAPGPSYPPPQIPAPDVITASVHFLRCPNCGTGALTTLGQKGSLGKSVAVSAAFGAIGNLVASSGASKDFTTSPMKYRCDACGNKFMAPPMQARPEELLPAPCAVYFERLSSFVGSMVAQIVYLNGVKIGPVKNGRTLAFRTGVRFNALTVTDQYGVAFKSAYRFEARPGESITVRFKRKFI